MSFHHRIRTIYGKELIDILRDRRTLIAMIVVPIVLYPLLMLGSLQAMSLGVEKMVQDVLLVGVVSESHRQNLARLINDDARALRREREGADARTTTGIMDMVVDALAQPLDELTRIAMFESIDALDAAIRERRIHVGVVFAVDTLIDDPAAQNAVSIRADQEDVRSQSAAMRIQEMLNRITTRTVEARKRQADLPPLFDRPFEITTVDLSSPPSILGQILPLVLILMTITGAIYPAIDLTAGERERGTLESLMVCPVPVIDLIVGKFLVVTTVAVMGAALNLMSVSATVYFGGFNKVIASSGAGIPWATMSLILLCLIPFAILMSAIMIAVSSYARTFKEAQNYVTPVILAVLIPGGIAALPTTKAEGAMLVMPVGNMVLLARELLLGAHVPYWQVGLVLVSTTFYAGAAVALAAGIFGKESVVFADAGSWKATFSRGLMKPSPAPGISMALLVTALLFPIWFFVQAGFSPGEEADAAPELLYGTGIFMPLLFVIVPAIILSYWKIDLRNTFFLRVPRLRYFAAAVLIGLSAWVPAHELAVLQASVIPLPEALVKSSKMLEDTLAALPFGPALVFIAVVPAVCEELLFRGLLLSGLGTVLRKWAAILTSAVVFGIFHFFVFKLPVTIALGVVLGYLCWQSRSILPAMIAHFLHNGLLGAITIRPVMRDWIGLSEAADSAHLPARILLGGLVLFVVGLILTARSKVAPPRVPVTVPGAA